MTKWTLGQLGKTNPKRTQNEPKSKKVKMNVTNYITTDYENKSNWAICENEPNSNPKQTQFQSQYMLDNLERPNPEYDKPFNKHASELFQKWPG